MGTYVRPAAALRHTLLTFALTDIHGALLALFGDVEVVEPGGLASAKTSRERASKWMNECTWWRNGWLGATWHLELAKGSSAGGIHAHIRHTQPPASTTYRD